MFNKPFQNSLRDHRTKAGLLQRDVAKLLGMDCADRLSRWENGQAVPSIVNLFKLAVLFKVEPHLLYPELYRHAHHLRADDHSSHKSDQYLVST